MQVINEANLPGRLGNAEVTIGTDPRTDPLLGSALAALGLDNAAAELPVGHDDPLEARLAVVDAVEAGFEALFGSLVSDLEPTPGVTRTTEVITGVDGNDITLYISRPTNGVGGPLPGLLHLHGGGMAFLSAANAMYTRVRDDLAASGCVVIGVEYRNCAGALGPHPFPAGLNDCMSALEWMHSQRAELGLTSIVTTGESGGGNLSLAVAIKARRDGVPELIDGVYAMAPYISGLYGMPHPELPSLVENDGYFIGEQMMSVLASLYDPTGEHDTNPLAWPYHASEADLNGLPPHVIVTDELDPLRDEGQAYLRTLQRSGVDAIGRIVSGVCHGGELIAISCRPSLYAASIRDLYGFAAGLTPR